MKKRYNYIVTLFVIVIAMIKTLGVVRMTIVQESFYNITAY